MRRSHLLEPLTIFLYDFEISLLASLSPSLPSFLFHATSLLSSFLDSSSPFLLNSDSPRSFSPPEEITHSGSSILNYCSSSFGVDLDPVPDYSAREGFHFGSGITISESR